MIDLSINKKGLERAIKRARDRNIIIPTLAQQKNPKLVPQVIKDKLKDVGLWDVDSLNLFRITWKNQPTTNGGGYGGVNFVEIPPELTGVKARIIGLVGKWFPTGAHKVGASFGCLVPPLVTGQFDPSTSKAAWPSTGNYCRGGAYNSSLLACDSIAILPEGMSKERFEWLSKIASEVIPTPGSESNVKEIFDKCWELRKTRKDVQIFNQFDEFGNYLWHHEVTGAAMEELLTEVMTAKQNFAGVVLSAGSGGTLASGDYLKKVYPTSKIAVSEALQCPTLLNNGFGAHRIEGIGDKHVPWIHNVKNTDMVMAIDDNDAMNVIRLFNEEAGQAYLAELGIEHSTIEQLPLLGISGVANLLSAIKFARYYELTSDDVVLTVFTDSMELYGSRLKEMTAEHGPYNRDAAIADYQRSLIGTTIDYMAELDYYQRKRIHNLKYFTWIEQQGRELDELNAQWYDAKQYWNRIPSQAGAIDDLITMFNDSTGLLAKAEERVG